jgi:light-regulated signal transduction histidine kinase (bacteriophytochrome)
MDKPHGLIEISCIEDDDYWKFSVADNGPGIDEQYYEKIFGMFQTLSTKNHTEKVGIGLTIVKKIVELYNGKVWVESKLGEGSTFFFTLHKQSVESANENKLCASSIN